ncbi:MAG: hypothetical protein ACTIAO_06450 [Microbacterium sp.]
MAEHARQIIEPADDRLDFKRFLVEVVAEAGLILTRKVKNPVLLNEAGRDPPEIAHSL